METLELNSIAESIQVSLVGPPATVAVHKECIKPNKRQWKRSASIGNDGLECSWSGEKPPFLNTDGVVWQVLSSAGGFTSKNECSESVLP